jgi:ubiquinol-cytochrome c reductase cytochrome b subunit
MAGMTFDSTYSAALLSHTLSIKDDNKIKGYNRVGPHNIDILSIIFGSLLGKGVIERKKDGPRVTFYQEAVHVKYLLFLHNQLASLGYCNPTVPKIGTKLGKKGKVYRTLRFSTLTYTSFD